MRPALWILRAAILTGPTALAFASGGYFDRARQIALIVAWVLAAVAVVLSDRPLPHSRAGAVALLALAAYAGWIGLSTSWAPLHGPARGDFERAVLYAGALLAVAAAFRPRAAARAVEPALAAGTVIVSCYGPSGRLVPGLVHQHPSGSALGRLDQPLTYWNAQGALAAIGFVLCARVAGDGTRAGSMRRAAAAGSVPLAAAVYLSFSRGALAALAAGLVVLLVAARSRQQVRAALVCVSAGVLAAIAAGLTEGVRKLAGGLAGREREGAVVLAVLVILTVAAGIVVAWSERADSQRADAIPLPRWAPVATTILVIAILAVPVALAGTRSSASSTGAGNARFSSVGSNRYQYWRSALETAADHPLSGVGASGFAVEWARRRTIDEPVRDAHSLEIETLAELGLVGFALLMTLLVSVALAARRAYRADPVLGAGLLAVLVTWTLHAAIDWDWEMPAVTLLAVIAAGTLVARAD
jgi:O-Antigen ligase